MTGSDRRDGPEWPIAPAGTDIDQSRTADSPRQDRALRFGGEYERHVRDEAARSHQPAKARDDDEPELVARKGHGRSNLILLAVGALLLLLLLAWLFTGNRSADQDKLINPATRGTASAPAAPEKLCASSSTYDLIKRELFRRAAQVRGSNQAAYDQIA